MAMRLISEASARNIAHRTTIAIRDAKIGSRLTLIENNQYRGGSMINLLLIRGPKGLNSLNRRTVGYRLPLCSLWPVFRFAVLVDKGA